MITYKITLFAILQIYYKLHIIYFLKTTRCSVRVGHMGFVQSVLILQRGVHILYQPAFLDVFTLTSL